MNVHYFPNAPRIWKSVPTEEVCANSLNSFKTRPENLWNTQDVLYEDTADTKTETGSHPKTIFQSNLESDSKDLCWKIAISNL